MKKAAFHNLGCKVNAYETEAMQQLLEDAGYEIVPFEAGADVYVINTCSVTNIADRKSRQMLHKAKKLNPDAVVVAAGCYVQAAGEQLIKDEAVDLVIGNNKKVDLVHILEAYDAEKLKNAESSSPPYVIDIAHAKEYEPLNIKTIAGHTRAFVKVQDGCNQFCSYCIIPYTRGRVRSRNLESILSEIKTLSMAGYQEVVLTGIHLSSYGIDQSEGDHNNLLTLICKIHEIEGIERIRLGSLEPRIVTEKFAETLAGLSKVCPHFHLSLQSGCDATLQKMNRRYTTADYLKCCDILRNTFIDPAITTDVIVGFPGETEEEFDQTLEFLQRVHFYEMHIFKYSKRAGTKAADMPDQINESVKSKRSDQLLECNIRMSREFRERFLGRTEEVLIEDSIELDGKKYHIGHTKEYMKIVVPYEENRTERFVMGTLKYLINDEFVYMEEKDSNS